MQNLSQKIEFMFFHGKQEIYFVFSTYSLLNPRKPNIDLKFPFPLYIYEKKFSLTTFYLYNCSIKTLIFSNKVPYLSATPTETTFKSFSSGENVKT